MRLVSPTQPNLADLYRAEVARGFERLSREPALPLVTEADIERHPRLVREYLRRVGVANKPRVRAMRAQFAAQMKMGPDEPWMPATVEQTSFFDDPTRLFLMTAKRGGIRFRVLHRYRGEHATFEVRVAKIVEVAGARGPEMDKSETVTMFNDLCIFAAPALLDANVLWEEIDAFRVRGFFTNAGHTVSADLDFDANGDLMSFVSTDRSMTADGKTYERHPWFTPVSDYREMGGYRIATKGDAIWKRPQGDFMYGRFELVDLSFSLSRQPYRIAGNG